jgi:hypothetical protein
MVTEADMLCDIHTDTGITAHITARTVTVTGRTITEEIRFAPTSITGTATEITEAITDNDTRTGTDATADSQWHCILHLRHGRILVQAAIKGP